MIFVLIASGKISAIIFFVTSLIKIAIVNKNAYRRAEILLLRNLLIGI
jgi:hypothetical protein